MVMTDNILIKQILICSILFLSFSQLKSQNQIEIINSFKNNDFIFIEKNSILPFIIEDIGGGIDTILVKGGVSANVKKHFERVTTDSLIFQNINKINNCHFTQQISTISLSTGEFESECSINYYFKKIRGKYVLYKIAILG